MSLSRTKISKQKKRIFFIDLFQKLPGRHGYSPINAPAPSIRLIFQYLKLSAPAGEKFTFRMRFHFHNHPFYFTLGPNIILITDENQIAGSFPHKRLKIAIHSKLHPIAAIVNTAM